MKNYILQCSLFSFPIAAEGLWEGEGRKVLWPSSVVPLTPTAFDCSTIMGLFGSSSRRPGSHPQSSMC